MKNLFSLGLFSLLIVMTASSGMRLSGSQNQGVDVDSRERFIGAWRLIWHEDQDADGKVHRDDCNRADCTGQAVFTRDGHMAIQVMYRDPRAAAQYARGGYEAFYGTYEINEGAHTFHNHVESALVRTLIGMDLIRVYEFSGKQLIVKPGNPDEHWRVAWEHY